MPRPSAEKRHYDNESGKADLMRLNKHGESGWNKVNFVDREGENKRDEIKEDLTDAAKKFGLRPEEFTKRLDNAKNNGEIFAVEAKLQKMSRNFHKQQLDKSGLFIPMQEEEARFIKMEYEEAMDNFENMSLSEMIAELDGLKAKLKERKKFRNTLSAKTSFVQKEYFRRVSISKNGPSLLKDIENKIKPVLGAPSAVQHEFSKGQKGKKASVDTKQLADELNTQFEKRAKKYNNTLLANRDVFGGKDVSSKFGKVPLTLLEFTQWFEGQESFAAMDAASKKLSGEIDRRKRLHNQKKEIIQHLPPKDQKRINAKVKLMRRHELQAYLPELKIDVQNDNIHTAEYFGKMLSARTRHINLFHGTEPQNMLRSFRRKSPDAQKLYMKVLDEEIKERDRIVREYLNLPAAFQSESFANAHANGRADMLREAQAKLNRQKENPFDIDAESDFDTEDIRTVEEGLDSTAGRKAMEEAMEEAKREGKLKAIELQRATKKRVQFNLEKGKRENKTQKEISKDELRHWTHLGTHIQKENEAVTKRQKAKVRFVESHDEAWDQGHVLTSGGEVLEKKEIDLGEIERGSEDALRKVKEARYNDHIEVADKEGRTDSTNMIDKFKSLEDQQMEKLADILLEKMLRNQMGMSITKSARARNSVRLHDKMRKKAANNERFYE